MGLYTLCEHKGRTRDRCEHAWWARFRHVRVSLEKIRTADVEDFIAELRKPHIAGRRKTPRTLKPSSIKRRTAWVTAVLKAHGVKPAWKSYNWTALTPECRAEFRRINLRWHDMRHEYASRLVERGVPLAQVRDLLGHASITTTERYDNQKLENLQAAAARLERGETFDPNPREPVAPSICQVFVKSEADHAQEKHTDPVRETSDNAYNDEDLADWLGVRDGIRNWLLTAA